ncbi:MAG TPA: helix-turn-helix transcriptional regulator [Clostridiaceae bacterium]|nr:helix-turn-helix transcriptional regulator [Clostridiaceae bacterium]
MTDFSNNLKQLRKQNNLTQLMLARELGISRSLISHYENAERTPSLAVARKISSYFNVSLDTLIGNDFSEKDFEQTLREIQNSNLGAAEIKNSYSTENNK